MSEIVEQADVVVYDWTKETETQIQKILFYTGFVALGAAGAAAEVLGFTRLPEGGSLPNRAGDTAVAIMTMYTGYRLLKAASLCGNIARDRKMPDAEEIGAYNNQPIQKETMR